MNSMQQSYNIRHVNIWCIVQALQWCHNGHDGISNHQPHHCLLNCLFRRRSKKISKPCYVTGLSAGNSPVTSEFHEQITSNTENVSIWLRHDVISWKRVILNVQYVQNLCAYLKPARLTTHSHWNLSVIMMPTLSSLVAPEVVITTTSGATSDDKVGIMTTLRFLWNQLQYNAEYRHGMNLTCKTGKRTWTSVIIILLWNSPFLWNSQCIKWIVLNYYDI